jgi:hypothetical protein
MSYVYQRLDPELESNFAFGGGIRGMRNSKSRKNLAKVHISKLWSLEK